MIGSRRIANGGVDVASARTKHRGAVRRAEQFLQAELSRKEAPQDLGNPLTTNNSAP